MGYWISESYGILLVTELVDAQNPWVITGYGLSQVWVKTESTVVMRSLHCHTVSMFLSAVPNIARERGTAAWSVITLTQVMPSLPETFASMPENAGGWRPWPQLMRLKITVLLLMH